MGDARPSGDSKRLTELHRLGVISGLAAGAWLGAAEAPTKLVSTGLSPVIISFCMVFAWQGSRPSGQ